MIYYLLYCSHCTQVVAEVDPDSIPPLFHSMSSQMLS